MSEGIPFDEYVAWPEINASAIKEGARSMAHLRHYLDHHRERPPSGAMEVGTLVHTCGLEPLEVPRRYVIQPDLTDGILRADGKPAANPRATAEYKRRVADFRELHDGKRIVTDDEYTRVVDIIAALHADDIARELVQPGARHEASIRFEYATAGGLQVDGKARVDIIDERHGRIVDLKTDRDPAAFESSIWRYRYDVQAYWYQQAVYRERGELLPFWFLVLESTPPYTVRAAPAGHEVIESGRRTVDRVLGELARAEASGTWPGYTSPPAWNLPRWADGGEQVHLVVGGQAISI